ncbi:MAG: beta strand repeat-containing protein [Bacteroidales bacterium]
MKTCFTAILSMMVINLFAQVSINNDGTPPDTSAMLEVKSASRGFLPPRMTSVQMNSIIQPREGLLVYNLTMNSLYWFDGLAWKRFNVTATGIPPISLAISNNTLTASMAAANSSTDGYLASADWNRFNNKQNQVTIGTLASTTPDILVVNGASSIIGTGTTLTLANTTITAGTYGASGANIPNVTFDSRGRATSAVNRILTTADINALDLGGGTMSGEINMGNIHKITNIADPVSAKDAVNKQYLQSYLLPAGNISGVIEVSSGGTGQSNLPANKLLVGNGTSGILSPTGLHWDNTNGFLGIGISSPLYLLDVNASNNVRLQNLQPSANADVLVVDATGVITKRANSFTSGTVTSVTAIPPLTGGTVTTAGSFGMNSANATTDGYLTMENWVTFNNKEDAISSSTPGKFYSWDKSWRVIDYTMIAGLDLSLFALKNTTITGANGLTGGGDLSASRTIGHELKSWVDKTTLTGPAVISNLTYDSYGHPVNWSTRDITPADLGAEPAFTILPVSKGGTGRSVLDTYALLTGGTTASGQMQQLGTGIYGQFLQSSGTGALPQWIYPPFITGNQPITLSGDATGTGTISIPVTLATVNSNPGTWNNLTVNAKGQVTAATIQNHTGDATSNGNGALTLNPVMANPGTYNSVTVNGKGLVISGSVQWQSSGANLYYTSGNIGIGSSAFTAMFNVGTGNPFQVGSDGHCTATGTAANAAFTAHNTSGTGMLTTSSGTGIIARGQNASSFDYTVACGGAFKGTNYGVYGEATYTGTGNQFGGYFATKKSISEISYCYIGGYIGSVFHTIYGPGYTAMLVPTAGGSDVEMFGQVAPEMLLTDYGTGTLINGHCHIDIDPRFSFNAMSDNEHPMKVFIQLEGDCHGVYVDNKTINGFDVIELQGGKANVDFSFSVIANRKDIVGRDGVLKSKLAGVRFPESQNQEKRK